ncbi:ATP-binding protein [Streptomyces cavernicola]|uniref:ATP-binding protein n=1 Tax=Streptomyces cavernicola TaxID=3043613 RepID=A0ABT6SG79_9ACTN|nr:ATP-binding protein [Streptomyces sp. B-S-A6]MDI3407188.1 ATP-binding protein [Streptomyces sp. B-S-A6]
MTGVATLAGPSRAEHAPHPYIGGRAAVLRALASWRSGRPDAARVVLLTGSPGSGRSHLLTGFLMLCDPEFRGRIALADLDPSTVPPDLPAPAVPGAAGLTAAQLTWLIAEHYGLGAGTTDGVYAELAARPGPFTVVVPDVDRAGPVRTAHEPDRVVREALRPLAAVEQVRLLADVPKHAAAELAAELNAQLPPGAVQVIDLDEPQWADPQGTARQAEALLAQSGAARPELAAAVARRAGGSPLVVELAVAGLAAAASGTVGEAALPTSVDEALDSHAYRQGADPQTLRHLLAPLALAEGDGMPVDLWARLVGVVAGQDMSAAIAAAPALIGPFVQSRQEYGAGDTPTRTLVQLAHPAVADAVRGGLRSVRAVQSQVAMALLEAVPGQDWGQADPYVRDHIAGHTLEAGLLPQLLTDPGLFVHAAPTGLRAAVEAVPPEQLGEPARTYLRTVPLLTRTRAGARARAALLESAFVEDGLMDYAAAVHRLGIPLPWQTLWNIRLSGISDVRLAGLVQRDAPPVPVAALTVPAETPGARPLGAASGDAGDALLVYDLTHATAVPGAGPEHLVPHSEADRALSPLFLSRAKDQVRIWSREHNSVVASLPSGEPFTGADLSPDGFLLVATEHGARALRVRALDA